MKLELRAFSVTLLAAAALCATGLMAVPAAAQITPDGTQGRAASIENRDSDPMTMVDRRASINGMRLHYIRAGRGPVLILLHGWANTSYAWRHVIPMLADQYTIIAPDLRGFGDSSRPLTGYDRETVASDIIELMKQLGISSAIVAGHDLGAHVAFELAARHPELVSKLVVMDAVIPGIPPWSDLTKDPRLWHWSFYNVPDLPEAMLEGKERTYLSWFIRSFAVNTSAVDADMDAVVKAYSEPGAIRGGLGMFRTSASDAKRNAAWLESNKLQMPVLALGGSMGVGPTLFQQMQLAGVHVQGGVIEDCGHWLATECPKTLVTQMVDFFNQKTKP